jgi:biopolymer transport protein ExbD
MNTTRRIRRMTRHKNAVPKLQLTSLMDVFTTLVFFLVINSGSAIETVQQPKQVKLPESVVETKPRETVVIIVGKDEVLVHRRHPGDRERRNRADRCPSRGAERKCHRFEHADGRREPGGDRAR